MVLLDDAEGIAAGKEGSRVQSHTGTDVVALAERQGREMEDLKPLTPVQLLDAALWREIASEEAQPSAAFLEALSTLVGRWLLLRSEAPEMDAVAVLCKARGYISRYKSRSNLVGTASQKALDWESNESVALPFSLDRETTPDGRSCGIARRILAA